MNFKSGCKERGQESLMERMAREDFEKDWRRHHVYDVLECPVCEGSGIVEVEAKEKWEEDE